MILFVMLSLWREVRGKEGKFSGKLSVAVEICGGRQRTRRCEKVNRYNLCRFMELHRWRVAITKSQGSY
jgi:hypothetical protein